MFYSWNVIGHEKELAQLEEDFQKNAVHHAYLFVGPEKIGKYRVAKAVAGILQCENNFCHSCSACIQVEKKCHPDTIELEDDGESVKIGEIRDIIARLNMTGQSRHKILLIEDIGRLTDEAANCLLKILEEPPPKTIFIFTAGQLRDIMPTVASRMRIIHFKMLPAEILQLALKERYPEADDETINQAVLLSLGRSGRAIKLLSEPEEFQELRELYRHIQFLDAKAGTATRITAMQEVAQNPQKMRLLLSLFVHHFRQILLQPHSFEEKERAIGIIDRIHRALNLISRNINPRLVLENLMITL